MLHLVPYPPKSLSRERSQFAFVLTDHRVADEHLRSPERTAFMLYAVREASLTEASGFIIVGGGYTLYTTSARKEVFLHHYQDISNCNCVWQESLGPWEMQIITTKKKSVRLLLRFHIGASKSQFAGDYVHYPSTNITSIWSFINTLTLLIKFSRQSIFQARDNTW